jgi:hypothetical protein
VESMGLRRSSWLDRGTSDTGVTVSGERVW